jgi:TusA-related sulfurtransferase
VGRFVSLKGVTLSVLDLSAFSCPLALLELKRWLHNQTREQALYLILRADSADNRDVLNWLEKQQIELQWTHAAGTQHHYRLIFKEPQC